MKLNEDQKKALSAYCGERGRPAELARLSGVNHATIMRHLSGEIDNMSMDTWIRIFPYLKPYLSAKTIQATGFIDFINAIPSDKKRIVIESNASPAPAHTSVPVIGMAQAAQFDRTLQSFEAYAAEVSSERAPFIAGHTISRV